MNRYTDFLQNLRFAFGFLLLTLSALGIACTGTGRLAEGERLYAGAKVKINKAEKSWDTKILKTDLKKAVILPRPNKKILWMPLDFATALLFLVYAYKHQFKNN